MASPIAPPPLTPKKVVSSSYGSRISVTITWQNISNRLPSNFQVLATATATAATAATLRRRRRRLCGGGDDGGVGRDRYRAVVSRLAVTELTEKTEAAAALRAPETMARVDARRGERRVEGRGARREANREAREARRELEKREARREARRGGRLGVRREA